MPDRPRTTASGDSQSADTTSGGGQRGGDNAWNVGGRKRQIVVDSMGLDRTGSMLRMTNRWIKDIACTTGFGSPDILWKGFQGK